MMNKDWATFINTRPSVRYDDSFDDVMVIDLPLLRLERFLAINAIDKQAMMDFIKGEFAVIVVVSVPAAKAAIDYLCQQGIHHASDIHTKLPVFVAVGNATKNVLMDFGFVVMTPAQMSNEGMLAMPVIADLQANDRVLIWRGVGGRRVLHDALVNKGVQVQAIEWYARKISDDLQAGFAQLAAACDNCQLFFVLISSELAWQAWQSLPVGRLAGRQVYLTLGERLTALVGDKARQVHDLSVQTLSRAMNDCRPLKLQ
ncbi:MAG: uroporphyrinogen-III synthase [Moraxella sp.]|nr:uroporphyrinogen-III synthase [Moraxella sp.]